MKFIVSTGVLHKNLSQLLGIIPNNPVIPILENFLFEIKNGVLTVTSSDLETSMITSMEIDSKESGKVAVPAKMFIDILKSLPEQPVTITIENDTFQIKISSDNGTYRLSGENASDFPKINAMVNEQNSVTIPADILKNAIVKTIFATSNDDLRPAMTGVFIKMNDSSVTFVATDGHRLVRYRRVDVASSEESSIIIPKKSFTQLKQALPTENIAVSMQFSSSYCYFEFGNTKMYCRLIDERYPDYENVIPLDNNNILTINRHDFLSTVKRISIFSNKTTHQIRLKIQGSSIQISAEDLDFSNDAQEVLSCNYVGEDIEIGFNARFLKEVLENLDSEEVDMKMSTPNRAGLINPTEKDKNEDVLMLVMPVMLNSHVG